MSEVFLGLVSTYGVAMIAVATFLSCLALPIPASLVMMAGGAFVASGDLALGAVVAAAFGGAVAGDQIGFRAGRYGGRALTARAAREPGRAEILARARRMVERWGVASVFFSRWLVSPLGPWVNIAAGAAGMNAARFTLSGAAGEAVWVALYVGLGYLFAANIAALAEVLGNSVAAVTAVAVAAMLGALLVSGSRKR
jgi:membrane protein DedA with SNARE-associated domain